MALKRFEGKPKRVAAACLTCRSSPAVFDYAVFLSLSSWHRRIPGEQHDGRRRHTAPRGRK